MSHWQQDIKRAESLLRARVAEVQQIQNMLNACNNVSGLMHIKLDIEGQYCVRENPQVTRTARVELELNNAHDTLKLIHHLLQKQVASTAKHLQRLKQWDREEDARQQKKQDAKVAKVIHDSVAAQGFTLETLG